LNFSIEAELSSDKLSEIVNLRDNVSVTYDTGNITSCNLEHKKYIKSLFSKISNVHLKDRTYDAKTVKPGTGDTDFNKIFKTLFELKYDGIFTLQTARGPDGLEINTIKEHKKMFEEIYNEYK
jgi:sugar phosphate isomerase/epimerase